VAAAVRRRGRVRRQDGRASCHARRVHRHATRAKGQSQCLCVASTDRGASRPTDPSKEILGGTGTEACGAASERSKEASERARCRLAGAGRE
jgi:hypothetical protein